jgi:hypothetical protein
MFFINGITYKFCPPTNANQVVPASRVTNENMSSLPFVAVSVGANPPGHIIEPPHVTERGVPSAVNISVKALAPIDWVFDIVNVVMFAFKLT